MNLKGIIFDVHRTLVDDSGFPRDKIFHLLKQSAENLDRSEYYRLYDDLTKKYFNWPRINPFITVREIHRKRLHSLYQHFKVDRDIDEDLEYLWQCIETCKIYPEVPEVLSSISGRYKTGLLSNADNDDPLIRILLEAGFLFDAVVTSHQYGIYKPNPKIFHHVLELLKLDKEHVILVGDSPISDIVGAKKAGIKVVWINRKNEHLGPDVPTPDFQIENLKQLLDLI